MKLLHASTLLLAALVGGCGGGGDTVSPATPAAVPARSTALADNRATPGFDFALVRTVAGLRSNELVPDPAHFSDPARTYVSIWIPAPLEVRLQLAFLNLQVLQALDARGGLVLQLPATVHSVRYEVYDALGAAHSLSGEITR